MLETVVTYRKHFAQTASFVCVTEKGHWGRPLKIKLALEMAKRKVDADSKTFQNRWEAEYMSTDIAGKHVCLICGSSVAEVKEVI